MECPSCKADIPEGNRFCEACGAPAPILCSSCGALARSGARFCGKCGAALTVAASPSGAAQMKHIDKAALRRGMTRSGFLAEGARKLLRAPLDQGEAC
jgi:predicted amidophosphoribosyltransferase